MGKIRTSSLILRLLVLAVLLCVCGCGSNNVRNIVQAPNNSGVNNVPARQASFDVLNYPLRWDWKEFAENSRNMRVGKKTGAPSSYGTTPFVLYDGAAPIYSTPVLASVFHNFDGDNDVESSDRAFVLDMSSTLLALDGHVGGIAWSRSVGGGGGTNMSSVAWSYPPDPMLQAPVVPFTLLPIYVYAMGDGGSFKVYSDQALTQVEEYSNIFLNSLGNPAWTNAIGSPLISNRPGIAKYQHLVFGGYNEADGTSTLVHLQIEAINWRNSAISLPNCTFTAWTTTFAGEMVTTPVFSGDGNKVGVVVANYSSNPPTAVLKVYSNPTAGWGVPQSTISFPWYPQLVNGLTSTLTSPVCYFHLNHQFLVSTPNAIYTFDESTLGVYSVIPVGLNSRIDSMPVVGSYTINRGLSWVNRKVTFYIENSATQWRILCQIDLPGEFDGIPEWYSQWVDGHCYSHPYLSPGDVSGDGRGDSIWVATDTGIYAFDPFYDDGGTWNASPGTIQRHLYPVGTDIRGSLSVLPCDYEAGDSYRALFIASGSGEVSRFSPDNRSQYYVTGTVWGDVDGDGYGDRRLRDIDITAEITDHTPLGDFTWETTVYTEPMGGYVVGPIPAGCDVFLTPEAPPVMVDGINYNYVYPDHQSITGLYSNVGDKDFTYHNSGIYPPPPPETSTAWPQFGNSEQHPRRSASLAIGTLGASTPMPIPNWSGDSFGEPAIDSAGYAYVTDGGGGLHCIDTNTGLPRWPVHRWVYASAADSTPAVDETRDRVFYTSYGVTGGRGNVMLWCLNSTTGTVISSWRIGHDLSSSSPAIDDNGNVYVGAVEYPVGGGPSECYLVFLDVTLPPSQSESVRFLGQFSSSPVVSALGTAYIAFVSYTPDVTIFRYDPRPGVLIFPPTATSGALPTPGFGQGSPCLGNNGSIYYCMMEGLYKLDPMTLAITASQMPTGYFSDRCSPAVGANGRIYVGEYDLANDVRITGYDPNLLSAPWYSTWIPTYCFTCPSITSDGWLFAQLDGYVVQLNTSMMLPNGMPPVTILNNPGTLFGSPSIALRNMQANVYTCTATGTLIRNS